MHMSTIFGFLQIRTAFEVFQHLSSHINKLALGLGFLGELHFRAFRDGEPLVIVHHDGHVHITKWLVRCCRSDMELTEKLLTC